MMASPWDIAACPIHCRELIADSVEYVVTAHCADALVCISNGDKITPEGCAVKTAGVGDPILAFTGTAKVFDSQDTAVAGILGGTVEPAELERRITEMLPRDDRAWRPLGRKRRVSSAAQACAALTTNAARGAVRNAAQLTRGWAN